MQISEMRIFSIILFILILFNNAAASGKLISKTVRLLSGVLPDISFPTIKPPNPGHCLKLQCKYICFNGRSTDIETDVQAAGIIECQYVDELHLYGYDFPNKIISRKILGGISDCVKYLSIYASDVLHIEAGSFESQTLTGVHLENLKLNNIHKGIFENVTEKFTSFTLLQKDPPLAHVDESFLEHTRYQIKKLTIQTGLITVKNLTNSECLLNSLDEVNLSYNNFDSRLTASSFRQLSMVEKLNLTHSGISFLPESIFSDILGTLKSLDLSNNKLTVISQNIFGWRDLKRSLAIHLNGNPWECTCDLRKEMLTILAYQTEHVYCGIPEGILVTSETLCISNELNNDTSCSDSSSEECNGGNSGGFAPFPPAPATTGTTRAYESTIVPTYPGFDEDQTTDENGLANLECQKEKNSLEMEPFSVQWPSVQFDLIVREGFAVDVQVRANLNGTYGILWFSKVTTQYYKMEINYKEYGLGCYGLMEYITTVENLLPDTSYTFCLVLKDQLTVSPFSCKSVHIGGNLDVKYNAWLTTNMKATGITLVVIGIVLCNFLGILAVFLLIKQKPVLVKGSKRVAMQKNDSTNIIVFPEDKTLQKFKKMEEQIAKRNSRGSSFRRLSSVSATSADSNQSYMNPVNTNIYEMIPAYQCYLPTYSCEPGVDVSYAEIPFKQKRTSNDPLPAVPNASNPSTPALSLKKLDISRDYFFDADGSCV